MKEGSATACNHQHRCRRHDCCAVQQGQRPAPSSSQTLPCSCTLGAAAPCSHWACGYSLGVSLAAPRFLSTHRIDSLMISGYCRGTLRSRASSISTCRGEVGGGAGDGCGWWWCRWRVVVQVAGGGWWRRWRVVAQVRGCGWWWGRSWVHPPVQVVGALACPCPARGQAGCCQHSTCPSGLALSNSAAAAAAAPCCTGRGVPGPPHAAPVALPAWPHQHRHPHPAPCASE